MIGYHYGKKITVTNEPEPKPEGLRWAMNRPQYQVRSDAGGMNTRIEDFKTLTEARKAARARAKSCGWGEVFRWAESGTTLRKFYVCSYEREISA